MSLRVIKVADVPPTTIRTHGPKHQLRKLFEVRDVGVFHSTMLVGCSLPREVHGCDEIILRLDGESTIVVDDRTHRTGTHTASVIPAGTWHQSTSAETGKSVEQIVLLAYGQSGGSILDAFLQRFKVADR